MTRLEELRKLQNKTQTALAIQCKIEPSTLCMIEHGKRPSFENAYLLARALNVNPLKIWPDFATFRGATNMKIGDKIAGVL